MHPTIIITLLLILSACGPAAEQLEQHSTEQWMPTSVAAGNLRVATFNIRNYPELPFVPTIDPDTGEHSEPPAPPLSYQKHTNDDALVEVLAKLDFDLLAIQEIVDTTLFLDVLDRVARQRGRAYRAVFSENEGGNPQHIGFIYDAEVLALSWTREHPELDTSGRLRPAFSARFRSRQEDGIDFGAMVLHLASGSSKKRAALRAQQLAMASDIAASQIEETGDEDYMLLGDLNTAREQEELAVHDPLLQDGAGLVRQDNAMSCTSYWVKKSSNPMLRVSALDHVYLAGFGERAGDIPMVSGSHCAEHRCEQYESTDKASGSSFYDVSDHCPVYFEVTAASDDDA
jgi:endonuclease/exonuclease/phosphatase family metal-dependent hydrolase